jgi:hypothetical protein
MLRHKIIHASFVEGRHLTIPRACKQPISTGAVTKRDNLGEGSVDEQPDSKEDIEVGLQDAVGEMPTYSSMAHAKVQNKEDHLSSMGSSLVDSPGNSPLVFVDDGLVFPFLNIQGLGNLHHASTPVNSCSYVNDHWCYVPGKYCDVRGRGLSHTNSR